MTQPRSPRPAIVPLHQWWGAFQSRPLSLPGRTMTTSTPKVPTTPVMSHTVSSSAPHKMGPYNPAALISQTVAKKILDLNYVEMAEVALDDIPPATLRQNLSRLHISRWTEKYAVMAALLCTRFPEKAPELFAYLQTIITAERNYDKG